MGKTSPPRYRPETAVFRIVPSRGCCRGGPDRRGPHEIQLPIATSAVSFIDGMPAEPAITRWTEQSSSLSSGTRGR
jgi:hypothetical protein